MKKRAEGALGFLQSSMVVVKGTGSIGVLTEFNGSCKGDG